VRRSFTEELESEADLLKIFERIESVLPNMSKDDNYAQNKIGAYGYSLKTRKRDIGTVLEEYSCLNNATWREVANVLEADEVCVLSGVQNSAWDKDTVVVYTI
jgi:hypothetical protein